MATLYSYGTYDPQTSQLNRGRLHVFTSIAEGGFPAGKVWSTRNPVRLQLINPSSGLVEDVRLDIEPGLAANNEKYLLAFFYTPAPDNSGTATTYLYVTESRDGVGWSNPRPIQATPWQANELGTWARPSVAYDYATSRWVVAYVTSGSHLYVERVADSQGPNANDLEHRPRSEAKSIPYGGRMTMAPHQGQFWVAYRNDAVGNSIFFFTLESRATSAEGDGDSPLDLAIAHDGSFVQSEVTPALFSAPGDTLILVTRKPDPADGSRSILSAYQLGSSRRWDLISEISIVRPNAFSLPAAAGTLSEFIVAETLSASNPSTAFYSSDTQVFLKSESGGFGHIAPETLFTQSRWAPAVAFGP